ncbi:MAG: GNAT family N-acetyltransferase, partial [Myxococcota bacterium]|nr:GNAT family N-acetyltransferase [Myxococcota bacterium]
MAGGPGAGQRRLFVLRGTPEQTRLAAAACLRTTSQLWISARDGVSPRQAAGHLGAGFDAVVVDLHQGLDANALGMAVGFVRGGGGLLLRLPPAGVRPPPDARLCAPPHPASAVGHRAWDRLERWVADAPRTSGFVDRVERRAQGTREQAELVAALHARWAKRGRSASVVLAARGRGKSAALGLAMAKLPAGCRVVLTAGTEASARTALRFAEADLFRPLDAVLAEPAPTDVLVVDEAARLPVPTLQALVEAHPDAHLAFATTSQGYEGTGRGFILRFLDWLRSRGPVSEHRLLDPIRWDGSCPLESRVAALLALDARPAACAPQPHPPELCHRRLDRDALAADEVLLREVFGLLVHAHYRTTPDDLVRILDAPGFSLHVLEAGGRVVAVNLVAAEGALPPALVQAVVSGRQRLRGQALADTLLTHAACLDAGSLRMIRSVRIAVHPAWRRRGLGRSLADAVHAAECPDLFGTMFGATPGVIAFRRAQGYRLVRVGGARGERTGEPSVVMVRPVSAAAETLVQTLRQALARNLPHQLRWLRAEAPLGDGLAAALRVGLPAPTGQDVGASLESLQGYLRGPRPSDAVASALCELAQTPAPPDQPALEAAIIRARLVDHRSWREVVAIT